MSNDSHQHSNSSGFLTGLVFGAVAGAAGYFFLKTDEGKKAREKLEQEWEMAKGKLAEEGIIDDPQKTLGQMIQHSIQHVIEVPKKRSVPAVKKLEEAKKTVEKKRKTEGKKFKGV